MFIVSNFTSIYKGDLYTQRRATKVPMTKCLVNGEEIRNYTKKEKVKVRNRGLSRKESPGRFDISSSIEKVYKKSDFLERRRQNPSL